MPDDRDEDNGVATLVIYAAGIALLVALLFFVPDIVAWLMLRP
jgi:hypothetical protein